MKFNENDNENQNDNENDNENENENENQNQKNLRNLLHLRKSACRRAATHRAETKSNRAEVKGEVFAKISSVVALQARSDKRKS